MNTDVPLCDGVHESAMSQLAAPAITSAWERTFRFPNCEKRCPHDVSLQIYLAFLFSMLKLQVALNDLT